MNFIDWEATVVTEPPLLKELELDNLSDMKFHCYTQAVERCAKLITEAEKRHDYIECYCFTDTSANLYFKTRISFTNLKWENSLWLSINVFFL